MESKKEDTDRTENQVDSPINTDGAKGNAGKGESLTNDESASTDPNLVQNKASFSDDKKANERGKFDGEIGI